MNKRIHAAGLQHLHASQATRGVDAASALLHRLFKRFDGQLALRLWEGRLQKLGRAANRDEPAPRYTLVCRSSGVVRSMVLGRDPCGWPKRISAARSTAAGKPIGQRTL